MISLKPVVQVYSSFEEEYAWDIATFPKGYFLPISEHLSLPEIGAVLGLLIVYNRLNNLEDVVTAKNLVLPGGIGVYAEDELEIIPGCCCGLESWRGWESFLETGHSPWCGHDPETEVTRKEVNVTISHINRNKKKEIKLSLQDYQKRLITVEKSLQGFIFALEAWGYHVGFFEPRMLAAKFNKCFEIGARW